MIITVSRFGPLIRSYCGDGSRWNLSIDYITEDVPLGTIGGAQPVAGAAGGPFFVANSDVYTDLSSRTSSPPTASGSARAHRGGHPADGEHRLRGRRPRRRSSDQFREKPSQEFSVSTGIYCMSPEVFEFIPPSGSFGFDHLMRAMLERGARGRRPRASGQLDRHRAGRGPAQGPGTGRAARSPRTRWSEVQSGAPDDRARRAGARRRREAGAHRGNRRPVADDGRARPRVRTRLRRPPRGRRTRSRSARRPRRCS